MMLQLTSETREQEMDNMVHRYNIIQIITDVTDSLGRRQGATGTKM